MSEALMTFKSHIAGKNTDVAIWPDRIEWERPRGLSVGKLSAGRLAVGAATGGVSLLAGTRIGKSGTEVLPIKAVTSVSTKRDGMINTEVVLTVAGSTLAFRVGHGLSKQIKDLLTQLHARESPEPVEPATHADSTAAVRASCGRHRAAREARRPAGPGDPHRG